MVTLGVFWLAAHYKINLENFPIFWGGGGAIAVDIIAIVVLGWC